MFIYTVEGWWFDSQSALGAGVHISCLLIHTAAVLAVLYFAVVLQQSRFGYATTEVMWFRNLDSRTDVIRGRLRGRSATNTSSNVRSLNAALSVTRSQRGVLTCGEGQREGRGLYSPPHLDAPWRTQELYPPPLWENNGLFCSLIGPFICSSYGTVSDWLCGRSGWGLKGRESTTCCQGGVMALQRISAAGRTHDQNMSTTLSVCFC